MTEQFSTDDYHEPMYNIGMDVLGELTAAKNEKIVSPNVSGTSTLLEDDGKFAYTALTEYRARVVDDIHHDIVDNNDLPPEYVFGMLRSLSHALVDHVNRTQASRGHNLSFPPDTQWLRNHIGGLWLAHYHQAPEMSDEMDILGAGNHTKINLLFARDANSSSWSADYVVRERIAVLRSFLDDDAVTLHECDSA